MEKRGKTKRLLNFPSIPFVIIKKNQPKDRVSVHNSILAHRINLARNTNIIRLQKKIRNKISLRINYNLHPISIQLLSATEKENKIKDWMEDRRR